MANLKNPVLTVMIVVAMLFIILTALTGIVDIGSIAESKSRVICTTEIDADIFSEPDIEGATCIRSGKCILGTLNANPLSLFGNEGKLTYSTEDGATGVSTFDLSGFADKVVTEYLCTNSEVVSLKLFNDVKEQVDSREVQIQ